MTGNGQPKRIKVKAARPRPDTREIAVARVADKYSGYPSDGLTPVRLAKIFKEADSGDVLRQAELFEEMEEKDPHLFAQLQTRKNAVTGLDFEIIPFDPSDGRDKEIAEFAREQIASVENFEDVMTDLLDAIGKGFAVSEILWGYEGGHVVIRDIRSRPQKRFFWDGTDDAFLIRTDEAPSGMPLAENKFIVHRYKARSGHPSRAGILRVCAWMYLFKNYTLKDWTAFCEVYGMPLRLGKYPQGASKDDKRALMQALVQIGTDAAGIIPDGAAVDFVTTEKSGSAELYERLARYCDEQMSKAVLGQTLTSDSGGGSYAQSRTHNEVRHDLTAADCKALAATLRRDLIRPLVAFNFGEDRRVPYLSFDAAEPEDLAQTANTLGVLIGQTGIKVPMSYLYKKFSIPKPENGEEIAAPAATGSVPFKENAPADGGAMKAPAGDGHGKQENVDRLAATAVRKSAGAFRKAFAPILKLLERAESLEELRGMMEDDGAVAALYREMDVSDVEELLQTAMLYADLEGRSAEDGRD